MKTTVNIPDKYLADAMRFTNAKTKREVIVTAVQEFNGTLAMRISAEATSDADPRSSNAGVIIAAIVATAPDGAPAFSIAF